MAELMNGEKVDVIWETRIAVSMKSIILFDAHMTDELIRLLSQHITPRELEEFVYG